MIAQALSHFSRPWLPCIALVLFLGVFVAALLWVMRRGSSQAYEQLSSMILEDQKNEHA